MVCLLLVSGCLVGFFGWLFAAAAGAAIVDDEAPPSLPALPLGVDGGRAAKFAPRL